MRQLIHNRDIKSWDEVQRSTEGSHDFLLGMWLKFLDDKSIVGYDGDKDGG